MKNVDAQTAWTIGASGVLGVIVGSVIFGYIQHDGPVIHLILGFAFLVVSARMIYEGFLGKGPKNPTEHTVPGTRTAKGALGSAIGTLTGIIGLGGGYALVPTFLYFFRAPVKLAIGTSMASFVWIALVGAALKVYQGVANLPVAIALGVGALVRALFGAKLATRFKPNALKAMRRSVLHVLRDADASCPRGAVIG